MNRILEYRIVRAADGKPLVSLESPLGLGQELRPDALRMLAEKMRQIADEADARDMGRGYLPLRSKTEF